MFFRVCFTVSFILIFSCLFRVSVAGQVAPIVPDHERSSVEAVAKGPQDNRGILSVRVLGSSALAGDFEALAGHSLRVREITVAPDGVVAAHKHTQRPASAYIVEGEIMEFRSDEAMPILRMTGDVVFEKSGLVHWWHNQSKEPVKAIVMDIVPNSELKSDVESKPELKKELKKEP